MYVGTQAQRRMYAWLCISIVCALPLLADAQRISGHSVATTHQIADADEVVFGDIISYERENGIYHRSVVPNDPTMFGVAAEQPLLVHETAEGGIPIVQSGVVLLNVTTLNGSIARGDEITSSSIPGKGQRASENVTHVIGVAQTAFAGEGGTLATTTDGRQIAIGKIPVLLVIGDDPAAADAQEEEDGGPLYNEATILNIIQYIVAAFVAVGSVFIAFRNFMPNISRGVAAVGRNPRAKGSIQSMVIFNAILIVLISAGGFALAIAIILLPV